MLEFVSTVSEVVLTISSLSSTFGVRLPAVELTFEKVPSKWIVFEDSSLEFRIAIDPP